MELFKQPKHSLLFFLGIISFLFYFELYESLPRSALTLPAEGDNNVRMNCLVFPAALILAVKSGTSEPLNLNVSSDSHSISMLKFNCDEFRPEPFNEENMHNIFLLKPYVSL